MNGHYMVRINDGYLFFETLEAVKSWLVKDCDIEEGKLVTQDGDEYSIDNLEEIEGMELELVNESMIERGDEYCEFYLESFVFEKY